MPGVHQVKTTRELPKNSNESSSEYPMCFPSNLMTRESPHGQHRSLKVLSPRNIFGKRRFAFSNSVMTN
ncbi:hypothetical protein Peur_060279 [Populus x canadensis]